MITNAWLVLSREQELEEVGREVDTIKSGLGYVGTPMEGVLSSTRVEIAKAVSIVHISNESGKHFAKFMLEIICCVTQLQDGVPVPTSLDDVSEQVVEEVPPLSTVARTRGAYTFIKVSPAHFIEWALLSINWLISLTFKLFFQTMAVPGSVGCKGSTLHSAL